MILRFVDARRGGISAFAIRRALTSFSAAAAFYYRCSRHFISSIAAADGINIAANSFIATPCPPRPRYPGSSTREACLDTPVTL